MEKTLEIFCCYARRDQLLLLELKKYLLALQRVFPIVIWHDANISPGRDWEQEIKEHMNKAQIILLLVSPDFLASDYCYSNELVRAMERHKHGEVRVIPIILRPVYWQNTPFAKLQALPTDAKPVTSSSWHNQDEAFFDVAEGIRKAIEELRAEWHHTSTSKQADDFSNETAGFNQFYEGLFGRPRNPPGEVFKKTIEDLFSNSPEFPPNPFSNDIFHKNAEPKQNPKSSPLNSTPPHQDQTFASEQRNASTSSVPPPNIYEKFCNRIQVESRSTIRGQVLGTIVACTPQVQGDRTVVSLLPEPEWIRGNIHYAEVAYAKNYTIDGFTIKAAIFREVLPDELMIWINLNSPVSAYVGSGQTRLVILL